jgi:hypothetical protein
MTISNDHLSGFIFGAGAAAAAYYYYRKNQPQVDEFLRKQGIELPNLQMQRDLTDWTIDDLVREKERLEDLIAEREFSGNGSPSAHSHSSPEPSSTMGSAG